MNRIRVSKCGRFVECWSGGSRVHLVYVRDWLPGALRAAVDQARGYLWAWAGQEPEVGPDVLERLAAA